MEKDLRLRASKLEHCLVALLLTASASVCVEAQSPAVRPPAPTLGVQTLSRSEFQLDELRGKVVLVAYWASWCSTCIEGLPQLRALYSAQQAKGFEIVGISLDEEPKAARRAIAQNELAWPQICDGQGKASPLAQAFNVRGTPRYVLIDREGRVAAEYLRPSELKAAVEILLTEG